MCETLGCCTTEQKAPPSLLPPHWAATLPAATHMAPVLPPKVKGQPSISLVVGCACPEGPSVSGEGQGP